MELKRLENRKNIDTRLSEIRTKRHKSYLTNKCNKVKEIVTKSSNHNIQPKHDGKYDLENRIKNTPSKEIGKWPKNTTLIIDHSMVKQHTRKSA